MTATNVQMNAAKMARTIAEDLGGAWGKEVSRRSVRTGEGIAGGVRRGRTEAWAGARRASAAWSPRIRALQVRRLRIRRLRIRRARARDLVSVSGPRRPRRRVG